ARPRHLAEGQGVPARHRTSGLLPVRGGSASRRRAHRHRPAGAERRPDHGKAGCNRVRPFPALYHRPQQPGRDHPQHRPRAVRQPLQSVVHGPVPGLAARPHLPDALQFRRHPGRHHAHPHPNSAMTRPPQNRVPQVSILRPGFTHFLLIPLAALFAAHPLAVHGCSCGHDFDFHMVSWMEAARQFSQGNLPPHGPFGPAFRAGDPRFVFSPPLSWVLGALLGLLLTHLPGVSQVAGWSATPIVFTWIVLTLSGLALYRLARGFAGSNAALLAAILYLANPYLLFTAYERTAYGEMLAAAWIPLLLLSILRERVTVPGIALPIALLWLTNPPAAVMGSYTLA